MEHSKSPSHLIKCLEELRRRLVVVDEGLVVDKSVPLLRYGSESDKRFRRDMREDLYNQIPWKVLLVRHRGLLLLD
ncbi:hypothetical protein F2Q70_00020875 [Brassica cretica]|uniref:Uncharacterized protein n=1 Tax=Brassica cretica TaxID=69181 RepID=A0A8S9RX69_BRACR|nr:hypothetical protein F2Q70_00020875 [Brassica cretica]KAF2556003.1 hypothetical protein F2Q68_00014328 [Brassica cretica]KAF3584988.1 hypothetical protein F2Q69_00027736 [Brassica cretica]